jgi:ABC-type transport system, involved in lipoprotein release, permease component
VLSSLNFARALTGNENQLSAYEIKVDDPENIEKIKSILQAKLGNGFKVLARYEQKAEMYRVMLIERWVTTAILAFIILIISFNIIGSLTMLVIEKSRDISILQALGANKNMIQKIYLYNGLFTALIGTGAGMLAGYTLCFLQMKSHFIKLGSRGSTFVINHYPVELHLSDFFLTLGIIVFISLGAAYFPSRKASTSEIKFN